MKGFTTAALLALFSLNCIAAAEQHSSTDPATGAITWETRAHGVHFALTQILPEQVRAFYVNRGFTLEQIESYATSCVYMTVLRNDDAPGVIHFVSNDWMIRVAGHSHKLTSVEDWWRRMKKNGAKNSALIAFRWAQFPPEQEYRPGGDWNQGMLSVGLAPGRRFDATARWDIKGKAYEATLKGVECAE